MWFSFIVSLHLLSSASFYSCYDDTPPFSLVVVAMKIGLKKSTGPRWPFASSPRTPPRPIPRRCFRRCSWVPFTYATAHRVTPRLPDHWQFFFRFFLFYSPLFRVSRCKLGNRARAREIFRFSQNAIVFFRYHRVSGACCLPSAAFCASKKNQSYQSVSK